MLRIYFLHHRELFGELSRSAYETLKELMSAAAFEEEGFRPGMVSVVQTFGEAARFPIHTCMPSVLGADATPLANGCPYPISTIGWQKSSSVIACSVC